MTRENVLDRIAKLLALSEGAGATPNEAAVAAATAQRLMEQHQIDRAELGDDDEERVSDEHDPLYDGEGKLPSWLGALADVVTRANACRVWISTLRARTPKGVRVRNQLMVIGRKSDVQVAHYLFQFARREIERLVEDYRSRGLISGRTQLTNFRSGAVWALRRKLTETQKAARSAASSQAIVRLDERDDEAERALEGKGLRTRKLSRHTPDKEAWALGTKAGASIDVRPGVEGRGDTKRLGDR